MTPPDSSIESIMGAIDAGAEQAQALLLEYRRGHHVALPPHTVQDHLALTGLLDTPDAPYYCVGSMVWQGETLPVWDLNALLRAYADVKAPAASHVLVIAYQAVPGASLQYHALCAPAELPDIMVSDDMQCALPADSDLWPLIAISCFSHEGRAVPVLDTARLCLLRDA